jgi:3-polyprenyl-4-hydroxybenzoate decarboxylase
VLIIVVDDDIDPENPREVEWSLAARFRGHEDLLIVPGVKADRCDPLHENLIVTKIGMVATTRRMTARRKAGRSLPGRLPRFSIASSGRPIDISYTNTGSSCPRLSRASTT